MHVPKTCVRTVLLVCQLKGPVTIIDVNALLATLENFAKIVSIAGM